jgi:hypothetical protein
MIEKKVLSEVSIYFGQVKMPKGFEIEEDELVKNITLSSYYENLNYPFSITWDKLKTYITDFMKVEHGFSLIPKKSFGNFYEKNEITCPKLEINPMDLKNSPDFVFLYGVEIEPKTCEIIIYYDNNRRKGNTWKISLEKNMFIIFPSSLLYYIKNNKNSYLNFIQTITFEYI